MSVRRVKCYGCFIAALKEHKHLSGSLITAHVNYRCPLVGGNKPTADATLQPGGRTLNGRDVHLVQGAWPGRWVPEGPPLEKDQHAQGERWGEEGRKERGRSRWRARNRAQILGERAFGARGHEAKARVSGAKC